MRARTLRLHIVLIPLLVALLVVPSVVTAPVQAGPMRVTQVTVREYGTRLVVGIVTTGQILFNITEIETPLPPRVAIDILNAVADDRVRVATDVKKGNVLRVRVGQFQDSPPIARVVVDLVRAVHVDVQRSAPNILAVSVPLHSPGAAEVAAAVSTPIPTPGGSMVPAVSAPAGTGLIKTAQQPIVPGAPAGPGLIRLLEFRGVSMADVLGTLDVRIPQVVIQVSVVEVNITAVRGLGLWSGDTAAAAPGGIGFGNVMLDSASRRLTFNLVSSTLLNFNLRALVNEGKAKILTSPRIATLDGNKATIQLATRVPIFTTQTTQGVATTTVSYIDVGVKLVTTPRVNTDNLITLSLTPEVSSLGTQEIFSGQSAFRVNTRNADTTLAVPDGRTIVLGGLIDRSERATVLKVPLLGDIPILGELFRTTDTNAWETEVIFLITPQIVKD